ncbi:MAG: AAA family ATPase [Chloroflexi bacterium]|nr:AAA family ATPase [Chloroflexota bacterium]
MKDAYHCEESSGEQEKPMTEGYEASTPTNSDVKPTALGLLMEAKGGAGKLVRAYAAKDDEEDDWLESWFLNRTQLHCASHIPEDERVVPIELEATHAPKLDQRPRLRLVSIRPHYFRGYKALPGSIDVTGSLIVIEGKNSSGKTSLAEALEFLFQGSLSRREEHGEGNPEELENCIENQLRPSDESTFVEADFVRDWGTPHEKPIVLRRILTKDYGTTSTSSCESQLHLDGSPLSKEDESAVLDELFSFVPPLLMQHTLRSFVQSPPSLRRQYFERILALDELTDLIGRAVIGSAKLPGFKSPQGSYGLLQWDTLIGQVKNADAKTIAQKVKSLSQSNQPKALSDALMRVAVLEFSSPDSDLTEVETWVEQQQNVARQKSFPPLAQLRPKQQPNHELSTMLAGSQDRIATIEAKWQGFESARALTHAVQENALVIADALESMIQAGLIDREKAVQLCPLCGHESPTTFTQNRLLEIDQWKPLADAQKQARASFDYEIGALKRDLQTLIQEASDTLPDLPNLDEHLKEVSSELSNAASALVSVRSRIETEVRKHLDKAQLLVKADVGQIDTTAEVKTHVSERIACIENLKVLPDYAEEYRQALRSLETIVGQTASTDEEYRNRQSWLSCAKSQADVINDFKWEKAKSAAQKDLAAIRNELMKFRGKYLEGRRASFSQGMQDVWTCLREDSYSVFSNLQIPEPKGKGFPVVLEVKATLNDGVETKEIDALKVFSESQVNALGVAAFVTRSRLLGHDLLIFDDPVQSMDEDHFKTFARDVLPPILDEGRQVILLTHNETFARDLSYWHHERPDYVTLTARMSQKDGCVVDEGNRRFSERLRNAERLAKEGELKESWIRVRIAIERLYIISKVKYGPTNFAPDSWKDQAAEYMWGDGGVGSIIGNIDPDAGKRLKEILTMTAAGGHDKGEPGFTDLMGATRFLRELGSKMKVSD